jgi:hypothetical protein
VSVGAADEDEEETMDRDDEELELEPAETDRDFAVDLFMRYMIEYAAWQNPQEGAVSPPWPPSSRPCRRARPAACRSPAGS